MKMIKGYFCFVQLIVTLWLLNLLDIIWLCVFSFIVMSSHTHRNLQNLEGKALINQLLVFKEDGPHPPAAAACRQVLPRVSGVSIWKPADRTESLHIMLNLRPEEGSAGRTGKKARQHTAATATEKQRQEEGRAVERTTGVSATGAGVGVHDAGHAYTETAISYMLQTERETLWSHKTFRLSLRGRCREESERGSAARSSGWMSSCSHELLEACGFDILIQKSVRSHYCNTITIQRTEELNL